MQITENTGLHTLRR